MELIIGSNHMQEVEGVTAEYPYVLNRADSEQMRVPWHWHEELEFSYVRQGLLRVAITGRQYVFGEGEGFFLNTNLLHTMEPAETGCTVRWDSHMMHPMLLGGQYKSIFDLKYMAPILHNKKLELLEFRREHENQAAILELLRKTAAVQESEYREFQTRNLLAEIWLLLIQEMKRLESGTGLPRHVSQERIQTMLSYVHRNFGEKLTLDQIAESASISKRECLRCFQSCIGKSPIEYLMEYRVQVAERLLQTTDRSITEIAMETGFSGSAYFSKVFREFRGCSPSQYRKHAV